MHALSNKSFSIFADLHKTVNLCVYCGTVPCQCWRHRFSWSLSYQQGRWLVTVGHCWWRRWCSRCLGGRAPVWQCRGELGGCGPHGISSRGSQTGIAALSLFPKIKKQFVQRQKWFVTFKKKRNNQTLKQNRLHVLYKFLHILPLRGWEGHWIFYVICFFYVL